MTASAFVSSRPRLALCVLLLCLALSLLHVPVHSIRLRGVGDADFVATSQTQHRRLLSLISEYKFDAEVHAEIGAASARRSLAKDKSPASASASAPTPTLTAAEPPPSPAAHTDYVFEGY